MAPSGCTVLGLGIGNAVPHYEQVEPNAPVAHDAQVRVTYGPTAPNAAPLAIGGRYEGASREAVLLDTDRGRREVPRVEVRSMEVRTGSYWLTGLLIGAGVDLLLVSFVAVEIATHPFRPSIGRFD